MSKATSRIFLAVVIAVLSMTNGVQAQQPQERELEGLQRVEPEPEPESSEPQAVTPHHAMLVALEGNWAAKVRIYPGPDAEPIEGRGVSRNTMILGGHALRVDYKGDIAGQTFQGLGLDGYDTTSGKHFSTWMDSLNTGVIYYEGECGDDHTSLTSYADVTDPESGKKLRLKGVLTVRSTAQHVYEEWQKEGDGDYVRTMQMIFQRR